MNAPPRGPIRRLGLTGGIGSGKSTVAGMLVRLGAQLVDTDAIARALTQAGGAGIEPLREAFGPDVITATGALDRERMRALAFGNPQAKGRLEAILHPLIGEEARRQAGQAGDRPVVFDVPLLTESPHWRQRVERVLVIDCSEAVQAQRVAARPGWSIESARRVIAQQAPRDRRRAMADAVIHNDQRSLADLEVAVRTLWSCWFGGHIARTGQESG